MTCTFVLKRIATGAGTQLLRCVAEADDSGFCPVHRNGAVPAVAQGRVRRDVTLDVLPWTDEDEAAFGQFAGRRARRGVGVGRSRWD